MKEVIDYKIYCIEYDHISSDISQTKFLDWIKYLLSKYKVMFVDLFAMYDDILEEIPHSFNLEDVKLRISVWQKFEQLFGIQRIDRYVCFNIARNDELEKLLGNYIYSIPKIYRFSNLALNEEKKQLPKIFIDDFLHTKIEIFNELLGSTPLIIRDNVCESSLEILVSKEVEEVYKKSLIYLDL